MHQHAESAAIELPVEEPFDAVGVFGFLAERAIDGVERAQLNGNHLRYARTLRLPGGAGALELTAVPEGSGWRVTLGCEVSSSADVPAVVAAARRLLDLDADPVAVDSALRRDPVLRPLVSGAPGIRVPGTADAEEYLFRGIIGQQISVAAARTHLSRLAASLGTNYQSRFRGLHLLFPTPRQLLAGVPAPAAGKPLDPERVLRLPARSVHAVRQAAQAAAWGGLDLHAHANAETLTAQLLALPGIGPWTASYLQLRVLSHPDTWVSGDLALLSGAIKLGLLDPDLPNPAAHRRLDFHAERWSPWRSYAAMHLWKASASNPKGLR